MSATVYLHPHIVTMPDGLRTQVVRMMERDMHRLLVVKKGVCTFEKIRPKRASQ